MANPERQIMTFRQTPAEIQKRSAHTMLDVEPGYKNNWPRKCARSSARLDEALAELLAMMDDANAGFALPEFIDERVQMAIHSLRPDLARK